MVLHLVAENIFIVLIELKMVLLPVCFLHLANVKIGIIELHWAQPDWLKVKNIEN